MSMVMSNRKRMITDRKASIRAIRILDFDLKATVKEGLSSVANGISWVSEKVKEKVDPSKYASEKEAKLAEKQKLKELSTIKGCLKEIGKLLKGKVVAAVKAGGEKLSAVIERIKALLAKIKEKIKSLSGLKVAAGGAIIAAIVGVLFKVVSGIVGNAKLIHSVKKSTGESPVKPTLIVNTMKNTVGPAKKAANAEFISEYSRDILNDIPKLFGSAKTPEEAERIRNRARTAIQSEYGLISSKVRKGKIPENAAKKTLSTLKSAFESLK